MKKIFAVLLPILITMSVSAEEYPLVKIAKFNQGGSSEGIFFRRESDVAPQDDMTGNVLSIDIDGILYDYNIDFGRMMKINSDYTIQEIKKFDFNKIPLRFYWYKEKYVAIGYWGFISSYDVSGKQIFSVDAKQMLSEDYYIKKIYYDEPTDILFLKDNKDKLYSVINPCNDEKENRRNFKNPEDTRAMLDSGKYSPHLTASKKGSLFIDGNGYYWAGQEINNICYQILDKEIYIYPEDNYITLSAEDQKNIEHVESIAIHPSGDVYILRMNWSTNKHNLYRIENTWDPAWRSKWYSEHNQQ